jgi:branched-chain amino acid aminotransferase
MPIQATNNIWHNGKLIPWEQANIHVMSHVVHYGSSIFEGIRCYQQKEGASVFRLHEHMQRFLHSGKIYRMELPYTVEQLNAAVIDVIEANGVAPCYIRPVAFRGYGEIGVNGTSPGATSCTAMKAPTYACQAGTGSRPTPCLRSQRPAQTI